jgi:predicted RNase H-like HicB family nuclease
MISYLIIIEGDGSTNYSAYCPDLPGVAVTGDTIDECAAEMRDAIAFHMRACARPVSPYHHRPVEGERSKSPPEALGVTRDQALGYPQGVPTSRCWGIRPGR